MKPSFCPLTLLHSCCGRVAGLGALLLLLLLLTGLFPSTRAQTTYPNDVNDSDDEYLLKFGIGSQVGVSTWRVSEPYINLWIYNQPLTYYMGEMGPAALALTFKQRDNRCTNTAGFGPSWYHSWLSYVAYTYDAASNAVPGTTVMPLGGQRTYIPDGVTKDFKSGTTMTGLTNSSGITNGVQINLPGGGKLVYMAQYPPETNCGNEYRMYLTQEIDPQGHLIQYYYDYTGGYNRLTSVFDPDTHNVTFGYDTNYVWRINQVADVYGDAANFIYDSINPSRLIGIINVAGMTNTFSYDAQGLITNMVTVYGTTTFRATTNALAPYNLGGTNQVNRSMLVTLPTGDQELFMYRDQSSQLNPTSSVNLIPSSYPPGDVPSTSPLTNTFDNSSMDGRNSFHWDSKQYSGLSSAFRSSADFNQLTTNDYNLAQMRHWLRGYTNAAVVTETLSMNRDASPDGTTEGQKYWYDYSGKVTNWWTRGTNAQPLFTALVLSDSSSRFVYTERNTPWEKPTRTISTWTSDSGFSTRTNTFTYTSDGIDLVQQFKPGNVLVSSNSYNGFHRVLTNFNAVGDVTTSSYNSWQYPVSVNWASGLVTSNFFSGYLWYQNIQYDGSSWNALQTNYFIWQNDTPYQSVDPRGLSILYSWDAIRRATVLKAFENGTYVTCETRLYTNLDLTETISRSGWLTNRFVFDSLARLTQHYDPLAWANGITLSQGYSQGLLATTTNALGQTNGFTYDFDGRQLTKTYADGSTESNSYNKLGQLITHTDAAGISTTNWYNNQGLMVAVSNAFGRVTQAKYDSWDRVTNTVDANGVSTTISYDNLGRVLTRTIAGAGTEQFFYGPRGLLAYTNQLGFATRYGYDALRHKIAETNANNEVTLFSYSPAGDLIALVDGKGHSNQWVYDIYGRLTNVIDATGSIILQFMHDQDGRVTNRWSAAKGNTGYAVDQDGNVTYVRYPSSTPVSFAYDALNRVTNMVDAAGTTTFTYTSFGALASAGGLWANDTVSYSYQNNHIRSALNLAQPNASTWTQSYSYDTANRLQTLGTPLGNFSYSYPFPSTLINRIGFPSGAYVTNSFDNLARLTATVLNNSGNTTLNSHSYVLNNANQRAQQTRIDGSYVNYAYDKIGQLISAVGKDSGGTNRLHEQFGYGYDQADNLSLRTNNALVQTFSVDSRNQLSTVGRSGTLTVSGTVGSPGTNMTSVTVADNGNSPVAAVVYGDKTFARAGVNFASGAANTFTAVAQDAYGRSDTNTVSVNLPSTPSYSYDSNGNLTGDGLRSFTYDDENQLASVSVANSWWTSFVYDGRNRMRIRKEYIWQNSTWVETGETRYIYDGNLVIQERDWNNTPTVTYTRGLDLSTASLDSAGGIGGLLARTDNSLFLLGAPASAYYHADGNGNITTLINDKQDVVAKYLWDPFGNLIAKSGPLADANVYRFSSKEYHANSGLVYFGRRFYDPNLQRWPNRDPKATINGPNLYAYVQNDAVNANDAYGEFIVLPPVVPWVWVDQQGKPLGWTPTANEVTTYGFVSLPASQVAKKGFGDVLKDLIGSALENGSQGLNVAFAAVGVFFGSTITEGPNGPPVTAPLPVQPPVQAPVEVPVPLPKPPDEPRPPVVPPRDKEPVTFYHYSTYPPSFFIRGMWSDSSATTISGLSSPEASAGLGIVPPTYEYPVTVDPRITPVRPQPPVPRNKYGPGGLPEVTFPFGTPPGSVGAPRPVPKRIL
jgi:RHS repeat-associated protein